MKLYIDRKNRRFVKSAASNVALDRLVLKRRDAVTIEVVFVENGAVVATPSGTALTTAIKRDFSDANFLALADNGTLTLNTVPLEAAFATGPASIPAFLEVRWTASGEATRTATLAAEIQNSVIVGIEGTPAAIPDGKATQAQAEAGTDNTAWMTPLRVKQAIATSPGGASSWDAITGKPSTFPPATHTHTASQITDFAAAVVAAAPPTTNASLLTSGTLPDARLSAGVSTSLGKADSALQSGAAISNISGLQTALDGKSATSHTHSSDVITEGTTNLFFTAARAVAALASTLASYATTASVSAAISALVTGVSSVAGKTGAVNLVKADVGLGNVDNTSDAAKPVSTATQTALDGKQIRVVYSDTAPSHSAGLEWVDTTTMRTYRSYNSQWVEISTATTQALRQAATSTAIYTGRAASGTAESTSAWTIRRATVSTAGLITATAAASGAWTSRESLTYA